MIERRFMSNPRAVFALVLSTAIVLLASACSVGPEVQTTPEIQATAAGGGFDGLHHTGPDGAKADSMDQRQRAEGFVDELGYRHPIDVKHPRPERVPPARPSLEEIERSREAAQLARAGEKSTVFEVRLGPNDGHTQNETSIDIDGDTLIAGWNNFTDSGLQMGLGRSTDRGQTWSDQLFGGFSGMSDPVVKSGGNGKWYFAYIAANPDYDVYVHRSNDDGATWSSPVDASVNGSFDDKPYMDAQGDEVLVAWTDFGFSPAAIHVARSLDGGQTFNTPTRLSFNSPGGNGVCPVIGPDGTYYVFWRSGGWFIWMSRSTDQGQTWESDVAISTLNPLPNPLTGESFRIVNLPSADVDPVSGDLVVVWNDQAFGNPDIVSIRSSDNGDTWSAPIRVNDDTGSADQFFPWITFDELGTASVVWYDKRQNGSDIDVYLAQSTDGGQTWGTNIRVTASGYGAVLPWESSAASFIGDYNAVAANQGDVFPFYQDARSGLQDVYVAKLTPNAPACTVDGDCGDGLFCNGVETCVANACVAGTNPCVAGEICDEAADVCTLCGNGVCDLGEDDTLCPADCPSVVDCSQFTTRQTCRAESDCRWRNRRGVCVNR